MFGTITDSTGAVKTNLFGKWSEALYIGKVSDQSETSENLLTNDIAGTLSSLYLETRIPTGGSTNILWLLEICDRVE